MTDKVHIGAIYGYPVRAATAKATMFLLRALGERFRLTEIIPTASAHKVVENASRVVSNCLSPLKPSFSPDLIVYGNDGVASMDILKVIKRKPSLVFWYDAFTDIVSHRPRFWEIASYLRYRNILAADAVIADCDKLVEMACTLRGSDRHVFYMPVGVDTQLFNPTRYDGEEMRRRYGIPNNALVVGYVGYVGVWQGNFAGRPLAEAAKAVAASLGNKVRFFIVGYGPGIRGFREYVHEAGIGDKFTFTGYVDHAMVPWCLASFDICVLTLENVFPSYARNETKIKEYMAMGKAVVATAIGETVKDLNGGRVGILVPPSSNGLANGILDLAQDESLRKQLGQRARERAVEVYDWKHMGRQLEGIIDRILTIG